MCFFSVISFFFFYDFSETAHKWASPERANLGGSAQLSDALGDGPSEMGRGGRKRDDDLCRNECNVGINGVIIVGTLRPGYLWGKIKWEKMRKE